jgi:succinate-acetate transporter protein
MKCVASIQTSKYVILPVKIVTSLSCFVRGQQKESKFENPAFISYVLKASMKKSVTLPAGVKNDFTELNRPGKATGQAFTCWFLFTVVVLKVCCYRTSK